MSETMYDRFKSQGGTTEAETVEQTQQTSSQEQSGEGTTEQTNQETSGTSTEQQGFDVNSINSHFGRSFKDEEELKSLFERQEQYKDYDSKLAERDAVAKAAEEKYNSLVDSIDPAKITPDKEVLALTQLKQKYPDKDPAIMTNIRSTDLASMDKLDALVMIDKLTVPSNVSDNTRKSEILKGLGIDVDATELTESDRYRIEREFVSKSGVINEIKEFQPEDSMFDFRNAQKARQEQVETQKQTLQTHNQKALEPILNSYKETKSFFKEDGKDHTYTYTVDENWKREQFNNLLEGLTNNGIQITAENAQDIANQIDTEYRIQKFDDIVRDAVKQEIAKQKESTHNEIHSDSSTNKTEAPPGENKIPKTLRDSFRTGAFRRK